MKPKGKPHPTIRSRTVRLAKSKSPADMPMVRGFTCWWKSPGLGVGSCALQFAAAGWIWASADFRS
jgi:hypothetical protein